MTQFALLGHYPDVPQSVPRLAIDAFVTDGLSVGGSLVYLRRTGEEESKISGGGQSSSNSEDLDTDSLFLIAPRIGFALPIGEGAWFWPRGGLTYTRISTESEHEDGNGDSYTVTDTVGFMDMTLEANVVLSPIDQFGFLLGAFYDVPLGGSSDTDYDPSSYEPDTNSPDPDVKISAYGLQAGIVGWF